MKTLRNKVQLIGNVGQDPEIKNLENGKKMANFSMATNEYYKNSNGEKVQKTQWHSIICWGKTAEIIEDYVQKGKEIAVEGKLIYRSYKSSEGDTRYISEIVASEILLLGSDSNKKHS